MTALTCAIISSLETVDFGKGLRLVATTMGLSLNWQLKPYAQVVRAICRCNEDDDTPLPPCGLPSIDASSISWCGREIVV